METPAKTAPRWLIALEWTLLSTVGLAAGMLLTLLGLWLSAMLGSSLDEDLFASLVLLPLMGLSLGFFEWLLLRRMFVRIGWWIMATLLGWAAGFPASFAIFQGLMGLTGEQITGALAGVLQVSLFAVLVGILQWLILRRHVRLAAWWIVASLVGWNAALALGGPGALVISAQIYLTGLVYGLVTGLALVILLSQHKNKRLPT
jgi:hypothetical protein